MTVLKMLNLSRPLEYNHVEWLLDCEPRQAQLEAVSRSYYGLRIKNHYLGEPIPQKMIGYSGNPFRGFAHFMRMRLGKTPVALNEFALLNRDFGVDLHLIIAPNKYKAAWETEAIRFGAPCGTLVFESKNKDQIFEAAFNYGAPLQISMNYEALIYDHILKVFAELVENRNTMLTCDESVMIKNHSSAMTAGAQTLAKLSKYVRILTGKPLVQGPQDYYSQLRTIGALDGRNFYAFRNKFCIRGGFQGKQIVGVKNEGQLNDLIRTWGFPAERRDWLPGTMEPDYEIRNLKMTPIQAEAYKEFDEEFSLLVNDEMITADQAITKAIKLQQIGSGFIYDEDKKVHQLIPFEELEKTRDLLDLIDNEIHTKIIVIALFRPTITNLLRAIGERRCATLVGQMAPGEGEVQKKRFNEDPECRVMLGQFKAIKYGHTLMGNNEIPCLDTIYFENSYSLDDRSQTEERNQGEGQVAQTHIIDYVTCSMDRKIAKALQRKEDIGTTILNAYKDD